MAVNKVVYGTTVLVDLTADTVTASTLMQGYTAHDKSGALITGTVTGGTDGDELGYGVAPSVGTAIVGMSRVASRSSSTVEAAAAGYSVLMD